jgi:hypothetical protein
VSGKPLARNQIGPEESLRDRRCPTRLDRSTREALPRHRSPTALEVSYVTVTFPVRVTVSPKTSAAQCFTLYTPVGPMISQPYCDAGASISSGRCPVRDTRIAATDSQFRHCDVSSTRPMSAIP